MINHTHFNAIYSLFSGNNLLVIPTFQRPYRWEKPQIDTLISDIKIASSGSREHYLSPIHLIEIDTRSITDVALLQMYVDTSLIPFFNSAATGLISDSGIPISIYLVIDGQQRLITILAALMAFHVPFTSSLVIGGNTYPKIISGSLAEDAAVRNGLGLSGLSTSASSAPPSPAAIRISDAFSLTAALSATVQIPVPFFQRDVKVLAVCLNPDFALGSFLTLNDRGMPLTTLEKLKAHCMFVDSIAYSPQPSSVHQAFGDLYRSIESSDSLIDDEQAVQIATLLFVQGVYKSADVVTWGAKRCFDEVFSVALTPTNLSKFLDVIKNITNANSDMVSGVNSPISGSVYLLALKQRSLSPRALAICVAFHAHHKLTTQTLAAPLANVVLKGNSLVANFLNTKLRAISPSVALAGYFSRIGSDISSLGVQTSRMLSVLDLGVMVDACGVKTATFMSTWKVAFSATSTPQSSFDAWSGYLDSWSSRYNYLVDLLNTGDVSPSSLRYKVALSQDAAAGKAWMAGTHTVEHIFPQALATYITGGYGFNHEIDYYEFCNRLGNIVPLDEILNKSLNANSPETKAPYYINQTTTSGASCTPVGITPTMYSPTAVKIGIEISALGVSGDQRGYIDLRNIDMVCFAASVI